MKTIVNNTLRPLKISLSRGRVLRLGPRKEGQIGTHDADLESVKVLVESGDVELMDDVSHTDESGAGSQGGRRLSQGRRATFSIAKRGDR